MANQPDSTQVTGAISRYRGGARSPAGRPAPLALALALALATAAMLALAGCWSPRGALPSHAQRPRTILVASAAALVRAARQSRPGDTVLVAAGTYRGTLAPRVSGTQAAPIVFEATPGAPVTLDAAGGATGISVIGQHDLRFSGFTVTGASAQGVWVARAARVRFSRLRVTRNRAPGIQLKDATDVTVERSRVDGNLRAGIMELDGVVGGRYLHDQIVGNGHDQQPFNGDGIMLHGQGALVAGCLLDRNGDDRLHEHGIYAASDATGYLLEGNLLRGNAGAGVKAEGAGVVRGNRFGSSRLAIAADDTSGDGLLLEGNTIAGSFQHAVIVGQHARVRLLGNAIAASPSATPGDHAAVLVLAGAVVRMDRNRVVWGGRVLSG